MGGVLDGMAISASVTNPAFIDANGDDTGVGKYTLANTDPVSGDQVDNIQREHNSVSSYTGKTLNGDKDELPSWASGEVGTGTDTLKDRSDALTERFNGTTGHTHDGTDGEGAPISAPDLVDVRFRGYVRQGTDIVNVTGTSWDVSAQFSGYTSGGSETTLGVVTNSPQNKIILRQATGANEDDSFLDSNGNVVFARLTEAAGVWTLSFRVNDSGETSYDFVSSVNIRFYFQEIFNPLAGNSPVFSEFANVPSDNATADVITATTSLQGKVSLQSAISSPISDVGTAGTDNAVVATSDHVHEGLHSISKSGDSQILGDATLTASGDTVLSQVGQNIDIYSVPLSTVTATEPVASTGAIGVSTDAARADHEHEGLHSIAKFGDTPLLGDVTLSATGGAVLSQVGQNIDVYAPPLSTVTATEPVAATGSIGVSTDAARADHEHEGLHSISKFGDVALLGDVTLSQGTGITLTQVGQDIEISGFAITSTAPQPVAAANAVGVSTETARADHEHEGLHSISKSGDPQILGDATLSATGATTLTQLSNDIEITSPDFASVTPQAIASTGAVGIGTTIARDDHTHEGLHSIAKFGDTPLLGDVTLTAGTGITLNQVGQDIEIVNAGGVLSSATPQAISATPSAGIGTNASREDHVHEGLHSISKSGDPQILGDATLSATGAVTLTQVSNDIEISAPATDTVTTPQAVGSTGSPGTSSDPAPQDHAHEGVHSVSKSGSAQLTGDVEFVESTGITLTQTGNQISIASSGGAGVPVGAIVAFSGGYFTATANGGTYTDVLGNTIAAVNSYVASSGFVVCDGTEPNDPASPIFDSLGKFLPDLTDARFLQGSTSAGGVGGQNSFQISTTNLPAHTHDMTHGHTASSGTSGSSHQHNGIYATNYSLGVGMANNRQSGGLSGAAVNLSGLQTQGSSGAHTHNITVSSLTTGTQTGDGGFANSSIENRPLYFNAFYIMRIK